MDGSIMGVRIECDHCYAAFYLGESDRIGSKTVKAAEAEGWVVQSYGTREPDVPDGLDLCPVCAMVAA
jgi:hypothetical protein